MKCGYGSHLVLYQRDSPTKSDHTAAGWEVDDLEKVVNDLREKYVVFEKYEMSDKQGISSMGPVKGAWFKNREGNILSVVQFECEVHSRIDYYEIINL